MPKYIDRETAKKLKERMSEGEYPSDLAKELSLPYMLVYRIACGDCWSDVPPFGAIERVRQSPGRQRSVPVDVMYKAWKLRRTTVSDWKRLSFKMKVKETTLRRSVGDFVLLLKHRCAEVLLTAGSYEPMIKRYGLRPEEAANMDLESREKPLPNHLIPMMKRLVDFERTLNRDV